jgi:hypothetical protein
MNPRHSTACFVRSPVRGTVALLVIVGCAACAAACGPRAMTTTIVERGDTAAPWSNTVNELGEGYVRMEDTELMRNVNGDLYVRTPDQKGWHLVTADALHNMPGVAQLRRAVDDAIQTVDEHKVRELLRNAKTERVVRNGQHVLKVSVSVVEGEGPAVYYVDERRRRLVAMEISSGPDELLIIEYCFHRAQLRIPTMQPAPDWRPRYRVPGRCAWPLELDEIEDD